MSEYEAARLIMVDRQIRPADVTRHSIIQAMLDIPRERFVPKSKRAVAYADGPLELETNRWLLEPRVAAKLIEIAQIEPDNHVLVIGANTGYMAALVGRLAKSVIAIESNTTMAQLAQSILAEQAVDNVAVLEGELTQGAAEEGPYDIILINGAVESIPETLYEQLTDSGRLVTVWNEDGIGRGSVILRNKTGISRRDLFDAAAQILPGFHKTATFVF